MADADREFDEFMADALNPVSQWAATVTVIAFRSGDSWEVGAGRAEIVDKSLLRPAPATVHVELPRLLVWTEVVPSDRFPAWLAALGNGELPTAGAAQHPVRFSGKAQGWRWWNRSEVEPIDSETGFFESRLRRMGGNVGEIASYELLAECERRLPAQVKPFASWSHLADVLGVEFTGQPSESRFFDLQVVTHLRIEDACVDVTEERVEITIEGSPSTVGSPSVSVIPLQPELHGGSIALHAHSWGGHGHRWRTHASTRGLAGPFHVALIANGRRIDRRVVGFPSPRGVVDSWLDPGGKVLTAALLPRNPVSGDQRNFEESVATLLYLCGFASARYGHSKLTRAPDVIAFSEEYGLLVVECSLELPGADKLKKLKSRASDLSRRLTDRTLNYLCLPLMFVPTPLESVGETDSELVGSERVGLVCAEDIEQLLELARRGSSVRDSLNLLYRCQTRYTGGVGVLRPS